MGTHPWGSERVGQTPLSAVVDLDRTSNRDVRQRLRDLLYDQAGLLVDDAVLVVEELVSNAHCHGTPPRLCRFGLSGEGRTLRVEVTDASPEPPARRIPDFTGGRGLMLVDQLASTWGAQHRGGHKTVWAELILDQPGSSGHAPHLTSAPQGPRSN